MVDPPDVARMLELHRQGWGARRIARELGVARGTVRRYLELGGYEAYQRAPVPGVLAPHQDWLRARFGELRGNARVLLRELQGRGVAVSYSTLARAVAPLRAELEAKARATVRFETPPGQQMQVDFGELRVPIAGVPTLVHLCVCTLGFSRRLYVRAFPAERQEHWLAGIESAFAHFGGVPRELLVDNARALVAEHDSRAGRVRFSEPFEAFCRLHGTRPRACRPLRARTKGKVENGVGYVKRNALAGTSFDSFAALEAHLERWMREVADVRVHGTTRERPIDRFDAERAALQPYRHVRPAPIPRQRKVSSDCFVELDTNRYSVPHRHVGRSVSVLVDEGQVSIRLDGAEIARHAQLRGRYGVSLVPEHTAGLWKRLQPVAAAEEPLLPDLGAYEDAAREVA